MSQSDRLLIAQLDVSIRSLERSMRKAGIVTDQMTDKMEKRWERMNRRVSKRSEQMARDVRRAIAGVAIGLAGREVTQYADAWVDLNNKLAAASQVSGIQARSLNDLQAAAADARSEIKPYADLYARILRSSAGVVQSEKEVARITELTAKAFRAGGAAASEQAAGVMQLGQALGSGFLQGDELRSIRENAPLVAKAIADYAGVSIGELKKLGAEGKLTSDIVAKAILAAGDDIEQAFGVTVPRASDAAVLAFDRLKLSIGEYLTESGSVAAASEALASAIDFVADNVEAFADAVIIAGSALLGNLGGTAVVSAIKGLSQIAKGATGAARALAALNAATAFMGGPWVAAITVASGAIAYFYMQAMKAADASEEYKTEADNLISSVEAYAEAQRIANGETGKAKEQALEAAQAAREQAQENIANAKSKLADAQATLEQARADAYLANGRGRRGVGAMQARGVAKQAEADIAALKNAIAEAQAILDKPLPTSKTRSSMFGSGNDDAEAKKALQLIQQIEEAWNDAFLSKRQLAEKDYQDSLNEINGLKVAESEKAALATKALQIRNKALEDISAEEQQIAADRASEIMENIADEQERADEVAKAQSELYDHVMRLRAQALGDYEALAEAEYQALRDKINAELTAETGKYEALAALEEAHAETVKEIRERMKEDRLREAYEEAETMGEGFRAQWDIMREEAEKAAGDIGILFAETFGPGGSVSEAIGHAAGRAIAFGDDFNDSMEQAARTIASQLIGALVQYGVQLAIQAAMGQAMGASITASVAAQGAAMAAAMAPAAAMASLASFGANAAPAMAGIASTSALAQGLAAIPGFADGVVDYNGRGTGRSDSNLIRFSDGESVMTNRATAMNKPFLEAMNNGLDMGKYLESLTAPLNMAPALMQARSGPTNIRLNAPTTFTGPVNQDTWPQIQRDLDARDQRILDQFQEAIDTDKRFSGQRFLKR